MLLAMYQWKKTVSFVLYYRHYRCPETMNELCLRVQLILCYGDEKPTQEKRMYGGIRGINL
jgi:hypothetical protein